ncbi:MAG: hypothetical protein ABEJ56_05830 [Candidatus Nanohaloarchaea archaeon]
MVFKPDNEKHVKIGDKAEKALQNNQELKTSDLAQKIEPEINLSKSYIKAILTSGSNYFTSNNNLKIQERPEAGGGQHTYFWSLDK